MPVYNEAAAISAVVTSWLSELTRLGIDFEFLVFDDGSHDETVSILESLAKGRQRLRWATHSNRGHGPTILKGYREARGEWIFQTDSDGEMPAESFVNLWSHRESYDLLLGCRSGRKFSATRRAITQVSRLAVWTLFGRAVHDVNSPFRLIRRDRLTEMLSFMPADSAAPNVLMSGIAAARRLRVLEVPVPHITRRTGQALPSKRLCGLAFQALMQTVSTASRIRRW